MQLLFKMIQLQVVWLGAVRNSLVSYFMMAAMCTKPRNVTSSLSKRVATLRNTFRRWNTFSFR